MTMEQKKEGSPPRESHSRRVFVDAKIVGRHDPALPKKTLVAYVVEGREHLQNVKTVDDVDQTDEAELEAVAFAIRELRDKLESFTILCDNESVVSEIWRGEVRPRSRRVLGEIQHVIKEGGSSINIELLSNPSDKLLNRYVAEMEKQRSDDI